ncbi:NADPH-dependent 2,4-dienoyl-CoA reductase [Cupriavidus taiwanensis]|uniref:NADPH-dependent 2,4-dienoyl-CoA reductase n=1 Tax=Cupriavidus taiwanensis TaxID=164546 RepID=UPI000E11804B|nr:NADPH-dependent 2,4-dienoyl-CoA reductase [Cupriavidus taiwanensis]SOZ33501.1 2,4-dienoyl-CoA reductase, NADH and FMN-linked [Cupriavidus taiwanensis]SPA25469.1 2,4-dienoyl-CoA reductase, NADH and FMN-linked [Cupriavidus taiwanensis]
METFDKILTPLKVGSHVIPNRMVMGAMHTRLETLDRPHERLAAFYATRAKGEIGLILSGGFSPNPEGVMDPGGPLLNSAEQIAEHYAITEAVHEAGGKIVLQILHAGRYAKVPECVAPSPGKARINAYPPHELTTEQVWQTVADFAHTAALAVEAGYDGIEVMGSEGYLINEFTAALTNRRTDEFGGSFAARIRFPLEIVRAVRARIGRDPMLIYRISSIDLVEGGMTGEEVAEFARQIEAAGADLINTGVGWHESAVPTIAASVPRAAWSEAVRNVKQAVSIPVMASNRINAPEVAEQVIASGVADLVSMARPLLADPDFARKTRLGITDEINTCIACNQACLDRIFTERTATCLVNPRAGREIEFPIGVISAPKRIAVVGGGPAGMAFAINATERGHKVTLFEADAQLGGQLNLAKMVPGKAEFHEMLRYFRVRLDRLKVTLRLGEAATPDALASGDFNEIVLATGVSPRLPDFAGANHPKAISYIDVLSGRVKPGQRVAIIGAGGIGFDVAEYLLGDAEESLDPQAFFRAWGVDPQSVKAGGLTEAAEAGTPRRSVFMFQRKDEPLGKRLGKSTGWILKAKLRKANVAMTAGATYDAIDDDGLHYTVQGKAHVLPVDHVILCAGQNSNRTLFDDLVARGMKPRLIGGADVASELDALRAIDQATRLAVTI